MIYFDYNATTPLCDAAREAMLPYLNGLFGNPSSVHAAGREARAAIDDARDNIAALLHAKPGEIIFTAAQPNRATWVCLASRAPDLHAAATLFRTKPSITRLCMRSNTSNIAKVLK